MRTIGVLGAVLLLVTAATSFVAADTGWSAGTYWVYDVVYTFHESGGSTFVGESTLIVLSGDVYLGMERWTLAAISQDYDGAPLVGVFQMIGPPAYYLRWPAILDLLPGLTGATISDLRYEATIAYLSPVGLPIRIERAAEYTAGPEFTPKEEWVPDWMGDQEGEFILEAITLIPEEPDEITTPAGVFHAVPVRYSWERMERNTGRAFWVPGLQWWASAEGHEEMPNGVVKSSYTISLSEYSVLSAEQIIGRLELALSSMKEAHPAEAERVRELLREAGIDVH